MASPIPFSHLLVRAYGDGAPKPNYTSATISLTYDNPNADAADAADSFGYAIDISGPRLLVGARNEDNAGVVNTGKAYQYYIPGTQPTYTFDNPSNVTLDYFGSAVSVHNLELIVGAPGDDNPETDSGRAYVYDTKGGLDRGMGTPTVPVWVIDNPTDGAGGGSAASDQFGASVAINENHVVVGAPFDNSGAGRVYVYDKATRVKRQTITQPSPSTNEYFGKVISLSGNRLAVGAPGRNGDAGAVFIYDAYMGANPLFTLTNPNTPANTTADNFGNHVSISGNYVIVGVENEDESVNLSTGVAYVYDLSATNPTPTDPILMLTNPETGLSAQYDYFGKSVAIDGQYAVVGASGQNNNTGVAYIYRIADTATPNIPVATLNSPTATTGDLFGTDVRISQNYVAISAPGANKVYTYTLS